MNQFYPPNFNATYCTELNFILCIIYRTVTILYMNTGKIIFFFLFVWRFCSFSSFFFSCSSEREIFALVRSYLCTSGSTCTIRYWLSFYRRVRRTTWRMCRSTARSCQGRGSWSLTGPAGGQNWYPTEKTSNPGAPCRERKPLPQTLLGGGNG